MQSWQSICIISQLMDFCSCQSYFGVQVAYADGKLGMSPKPARSSTGPQAAHQIGGPRLLTLMGDSGLWWPVLGRRLLTFLDGSG